MFNDAFIKEVVFLGIGKIDIAINVCCFYAFINELKLLYFIQTIFRIKYISTFCS